MQAAIVTHNGAPAISINGEVVPPMFMTTENKDQEYLAALGGAGIRAFILICDTDWVKKNGTGFDLLRYNAEKLLAAVPDAYIILRLGLHPANEWLVANPDECSQYSDGSLKPFDLLTETYIKKMPAMYSLSSDKWRADASRHMLAFMDKVRASVFAERVAGVFFAAGGTSEWYLPIPFIDPKKNVCLDHSPAFRREFERAMREIYDSDGRLEEAWRSPGVRLDSLPIPKVAEHYFVALEQVYGQIDRQHPVVPLASPKNGTNRGVFLDVDKHRRVADFYRAWHEGTANSIIHFGREMKAYAPELLTGAFYGTYGTSLHAPHGNAGGVLRILDSGVIDFLSSPGAYINRQPGGHTPLRAMQDSFRLRGKIFVAEDDTRTAFEPGRTAPLCHLQDAEDSVNILKRDFGRNICEDICSWWFDQPASQIYDYWGSRYNHPEMFRTFKRQQQVARFAYSMDRRKCNDVAVIFDQDSVYCASTRTHREVCGYFRAVELANFGAPVDYYFHDDLARPDMPDYKLYIFVNVFWLTDAERQDIVRKVCKNGQTVLWMYAQGFINPDAPKRVDAEHVGELTGIKMGFDPDRDFARFKLVSRQDDMLGDVDRGRSYGEFDKPILSCVDNCRPLINQTQYVYPMIYPDDPEAQVLGRYISSHRPALAAKIFPTHTSIYCGAKTLRCNVLRQIARAAGCHIFTDSGDTLYANENFLAIHSNVKGSRTIHFKTPCSPYEVYEEKHYGRDIDQITVDMDFGQTLMFSLVGVPPDR